MPELSDQLIERLLGIPGVTQRILSHRRVVQAIILIASASSRQCLRGLPLQQLQGAEVTQAVGRLRLNFQGSANRRIGRGKLPVAGEQHA